MTNQFRYRHACFGLFQHRHNLLDTEARAFHSTAPFILKKSAENSLTSWHCLLGAAHNVLAKNVRSAFDWKSAMNQFAILFGERFMQARG
ncbi:hypothetical protein GNZ25_08710 [Burkholderia thailandensis]|nr:hypothetical protein [Burkholderia thailandensis]NOK51075.1 hypothetical protein [Burkholderia thailandensis]